MSENKTPRLLRADEISCRAQQVIEYDNGGAGAMILLYKDARVDMNILDETYGPMNWQRIHEVISDSLFCGISVWDEGKRSWVVKQDVGVESKTEATKGEASDSLKRAGTNWGIGRELYTAPDMFINLEKDEWKKGTGGKAQTSHMFGLTVRHIDYNDRREISSLVLTDKKGKERFSYGGAHLMPTVPKPAIVPDEPKPKAEAKPATRKARIEGLCEYHGITLESFKAFMKALQESGQISTKTTGAMDDQEFDVLLSLVHTAINDTIAS